MVGSSRPDGNLIRVSRSEPCPICGKPDWCMVSADRSIAICPRTSDGATRDLGDAGFLHVLKETPPDRSHRRTIHIRGGGQTRNFRGLSGTFRSAIRVESLGRFADSLGLSPKSLERLSVGWSSLLHAWSFPMLDGGIICGIRLRRPNGSKFSVRGGREGLFVPAGLTGEGHLLIAEGPTDTAALLDLGFDVIGRPNCSGGARHTLDFVRGRESQSVVIVADAGPPGERGANKLASALFPYVPAVRVIRPPVGSNDAREWKRSGATQSDVEKLIVSMPARELQFRISQGRKRNERRS